MSKTEKPVAAKQPARPTIKAVRGTRDLLPAETPLWNRVEATARAVFARYGFGEIRTPTCPLSQTSRTRSTVSMRCSPGRTADALLQRKMLP